MPRYAHCVMLLLLTSIAVCAESDETLQGKLQPAVVGELLVFRKVYKGHQLAFDPEGNIKQSEGEGAWTVNGQVMAKSLSVLPNEIIIEGKSLAIRYEIKGRHLEQVFVENGNLLVRIDRGRYQGDEPLKKVFLNGDEKRSDFVPDYWRDFTLQLEHTFKQASKQMNNEHYPDLFDISKEKPSKDSSPPKALSTPEPTPSESILSKYPRGQAKTILSIKVNKEGKISTISIKLPCGMGLDDEAVEAVKKWTFEPAEMHKVPVDSVIQVLFNFH